MGDLVNRVWRAEVWAGGDRRGRRSAPRGAWLPAGWSGWPSGRSGAWADGSEGGVRVCHPCSPPPFFSGVLRERLELAVLR